MNINIAYILTPFIILPVLILLKLANQKKNIFLTVICISFTTIVLFDVLIDALYSIIFNYDLVEEIIVGENLFSSFLLLVIQYNLFVIIIYLNRNKFNSNKNRLNMYGYREEKFISFFILFGGLYQIFFFIIPLVQGNFFFTYGNLQGNDMTSSNPFEIFSEFPFIGTIFSPIFLLSKRTKKNIILVSFSWLLILSFLMKTFSGTRAPLFSFALIYFTARAILSLKIFEKKTIFVITIFFILVLPFFQLLENNRLNGIKLSLKDAYIVLSSGNVTAKEIDTKGALYNFAWRCLGARQGSVLIYDAKKNGELGVSKILQNALIIIPRFLWQNKPQGSSRDGTYSGTATFQVSKIITQRDDTNNQTDTITTASIAFWTLGWPGVFLSALFSALIILILNFFYKGNYSVLPILLFLILTYGGWYTLNDLGGMIKYFFKYFIFIFIALNYYRLRLN